ncbi:stage II sporulation protein M [Natronincola peptidivorans]|uniref:Stage II sporulation protein M n=1 Tax=Natronincola peptidivorans TaxID=426128 RepID=A0A1H9ZLC1_9FIRM|nr:stage II sporulation protein M [Natronincola peptidivorans]SES82421.1 stage II sporulation protein M [Natronincola peptidivorans]
MRELYLKEWNNFKNYYRKGFFWILGISIGFSILLYGGLLLNENAAMEAMEGLMGMFEDKGFVAEMSQLDMFRLILINNLRAALVSLLAAFIPIVILPAVSALITTATISVLLAFIKMQGESAMYVLVAGILPHGIPELTALFLTGSIGIYLSFTVAKKIFSKKRKDIPLKATTLMVGKSFLLIIIPLILIAAILEAFLVPLLL